MAGKELHASFQYFPRVRGYFPAKHIVRSVSFLFVGPYGIGDSCETIAVLALCVGHLAYCGMLSCGCQPFQQIDPWSIHSRSTPVHSRIHLVLLTLHTPGFVLQLCLCVRTTCVSFTCCFFFSYYYSWGIVLPVYSVTLKKSIIYRLISWCTSLFSIGGLFQFNGRYVP
jgi:hypothetical protein